MIRTLPGTGVKILTCIAKARAREDGPEVSREKEPTTLISTASQFLDDLVSLSARIRIPVKKLLSPRLLIFRFPYRGR